MTKELYIYSPIYDFTAESANKQLSNIGDDEDLLIRLNSPGGNVNAGFSFLSKLSERKTKTKAIIDGQAKSMAAYWLPFIDYVTSNDTSDIMFHKAGYPDWYEATEKEKESLRRTNDKFEEKMRIKVSGKPGAESFLSKLFADGVRNDVELTPQEALVLGIVDEVRVLEPAAFDLGIQIVAMAEVVNNSPEQRASSNNNQKDKSMDLEKLKAEHPALYAQVIAMGSEMGVSAERDRVGAWMAFNDIDSEAVAKGIEDGANLSQKAMATFTAKGIAMARTEDHAADNPDGTSANADGKTEAQLKTEAQNKEAAEALAKHGIK